MKKNVAGQKVSVQMTTAADGTDFTGAVTAIVSGDGAAQGGGGACTHLGTGEHVYAPTAGETDYSHIAFTFTGSGAITTTVQVYTTFPQTVDHAASVAAILADTGTDGVVIAAAQTVATVTDVTTKTGYSLASTGLDAIAQAATGMVEIAKAVWDRVLSGATHNISSSAGRRLRTLQTGGAYEGGAIWVDTVGGTAGTVDDENGVVGLPVDTWADALTLSTSLGLKNFHIANGSTVTLSAASANYFLYGHEWTLALGSQSVASTMFIDAAVSGTGTGAEAEFEDCIFAITSLPAMQAYRCSFVATTSGGFTMSAAGSYRFIDCQSGVAGAGAPLFTLGTGAITAEFRRWSGGIQVAGISSDDVLTIGGELGTVTLTGADGTVEIRGTYKAIVDNRTGSPTLNTDGAIRGVDVASILADTNELQTDLADGGRLDLILDIIATDTTTDIPALIATAQTDLNTITGSDGVTLATAQALYAPATAAALTTVDTVVDAIKVITDAIGATAAANLALTLSGTGVVAGTASGTPDTTTIPASDLASSVDDFYNGRVLLVTSGSLAGQITDVSDYTGSTKTLTVVAMTTALTATETFLLI